MGLSGPKGSSVSLGLVSLCYVLGHDGPMWPRCPKDSNDSKDLDGPKGT